MRAVSLLSRLALLLFAVASTSAAATNTVAQSWGGGREVKRNERAGAVAAEQSVSGGEDASSSAAAREGAAGQAAAAAEADVKAKLPAGDCMILNYALTLEYIEDAFYRESLRRLRQEDFENARVPNAAQVYRNFLSIAGHERQHVKTLRRTISSFCGTPLPPCKYNFGVSDVHNFLTAAHLLEKSGVAAYGGAVALISNGDIQTAAATIAAVEGRHASFINSVSGHDPFPQDFETPLAGPAIVTMVASIIESCPFDIPSMLGASPFKSLKLVSPAPISSGRNIRLEYQGSGSGGHFCSFLFSDKSVTVALVPASGCKVPKGARGGIFVAVIKRDEQLTLKNTQALIIAGPIVINVDSDVDERSDHFLRVPSPPYATPTTSHPFPQQTYSSGTVAGSAVSLHSSTVGGAAQASATVIQGSNYPGIPVHHADFDPLYTVTPDGGNEPALTAGSVEGTGATGNSAYVLPSSTLFEVQPTTPAAPPPAAPGAAAAADPDAPVAYVSAVDPAAPPASGEAVAAAYRAHVVHAEAPVEAMHLASTASAADLGPVGGEDDGGDERRERLDLAQHRRRRRRD